MQWKRLLAAAAAAASLSAFVAPTRAETVDPVLTQNQANRLSLFHDYGITAVGTDNYFALPANVRNLGDTAYDPVPGPPGSGLLSAALPARYVSTDPNPTGRPFDLTAQSLVGFDSNPEARINARGSIFAGGDLGVRYRIEDGPDDPVAGPALRAEFAYDVLGAAYEGQVQNADVIQQNASANVRQTLFDNSIIFRAAVADAFTAEHGSAFLNTIDTGATGEFFFIPKASVETGFDYTKLSYFYDAVLPSQKADADRYTFVAKAHLYPVRQNRGAKPDESPDVLGDVLRGSLRRLTIDYAHVWNRPDRRNARDYRFQANRIGFGLDGLTLPGRVGDTSLGRFGRAVSVDVQYHHESQQYGFANSLSPPILAGRPRGRIHRKDDIDVFTLRGNARLFDLPRDAGGVSAYVQWDVFGNGSNVRARAFNEFAIAGGVTYQY